MADLIRGLDHLIADLDTRQRQGNPSKNRALQKISSVSDTIGVGQDSQTVTTYTPPFQFAIQSYRRAVMADSPAAYWRLGEIAPALTANDEQANSYGAYNTSGTLRGYSPPVNSGADRSVYFDGVNGGIIFASTTTNTFTTALTLEAWMKSTGVAGVDTRIISRRVANTGSYEMNFLNAGQINFFGGSTIGTFASVSSVALANDGSWHHCVVRWDQPNASIFIDLVGSSFVTTGTTALLSNTTRDFRIGQNSLGTQVFKGYIDEVAIYSVSLTTTQIANHYNAMVNKASTGTKATVGMSQFR